MENDFPDVRVQMDPTLDSVRRRGQGYLGYLLWIFGILGLLWTANAVLALFQRWTDLLRGLRQTLGLHPPVSGPDWWVIAGAGLLAGIGLAGCGWAYAAYRAAWNRRLVA